MKPNITSRFSWNTELTNCRATALDRKGDVLGEVTLAMTPETARSIWSRAAMTRFRVEGILDQHLRAMLALAD